MATDVQALLWGAGILALPLIMALPMRLAWQIWVGIGHEVSEYRTIVRQIVDSGHQVSSFSQTLDDIARNLRISPAKQRLIEAEMLHPLTLSHFLLLPALLILPLTAIMALPVVLIGFPFMLFIEFVLIRVADDAQLPSGILLEEIGKLCDCGRSCTGRTALQKRIVHCRNTHDLSWRHAFAQNNR